MCKWYTYFTFQANVAFWNLRTNRFCWTTRFVKGLLHWGLTFSSIWHLFKSAERNSRWNLPSADSIRKKRKRVLNIHDHIHDSIRYPLRCQRGQVTALSTLNSVRTQLDNGPTRDFRERAPNSLSLHVVSEVNAPLTPAGGRLLWAKGQSNRSHLAKTTVKGSGFLYVRSWVQRRYPVPHVEGTESL